MFAEDVGLIPARSFTALLESLCGNIGNFPPLLASLWATMRDGGFSPVLREKLLRFNGGLFLAPRPGHFRIHGRLHLLQTFRRPLIAYAAGRSAIRLLPHLTCKTAGTHQGRPYQSLPAPTSFPLANPSLSC